MWFNESLAQDDERHKHMRVSILERDRREWILIVVMHRHAVLP